MNEIQSELTLSQFKPNVMLKRPNNTPRKPKFPVIDAHNHLFGDLPANDLIEIMDQAGVQTFLNVTGNATLPLVNNCYTIKRLDFTQFKKNYIDAYPSRFAAFTMAEFAKWDDPVLIDRNNTFARKCIEAIEFDVENGSSGLKVTKELGLHFTDSNGNFIPVDDERLFPIWERCAELGIPVLIHTSDPWGFFLPINEKNEHYPTLREFPGWSFYGSYFSKQELLDQRERVIALHPKTKFILPHMANNPEDLDYVAYLLDSYPNVMIDFSARIDELGRQPYSSRDFFIKYQSRILFGTDIPANPDVYRCYYRFLETWDEYFEYPDYIGRWGKSRWKIYGLGLPEEVLKKIYSENACRLIPQLAQ